MKTGSGMSQTETIKDDIPKVINFGRNKLLLNKLYNNNILSLKGLISMTGLGMKKRGRPKKILTEVVNNQVRVRKGKGVLSNIIKTVAPAVTDAAAGAVKNKVETIGSGVAKKKILGQGIKKVAKKPRKRKGGSLFPAGNYGPRD